MKSTEGISICGYTYIWAALLVLTVPLRWLLAALIAAIFHELGHYLAVRIFGGKVKDIQAGPTGLRMYAASMTLPKQIFCSLMGPIFSFTLLLFLHTFPRLALCGLFQGLYNLLPMHNLDGGHAVVVFVQYMCGIEKAERVSECLDKAIRLVCFIMIAIYGAVFNSVIGLLLITAWLYAVIRRKKLAKKGRK